MRILVLPVSLIILATASAVENSPPIFERDIRPILRAHCFKCHGLEGLEADLDLRNVALMLRGGASGAALVPGSTAQSLLHKRVSERSMPPEKELPLTDEAVETIRRWIDTGARAIDPEPVLSAAEAPAITTEDRQFWAFQKPRWPDVPAVTARQRARTPVDALVLEKLGARGLGLSADADRRCLIRRVTLDLLGLPPSPDEVDEFLADRRPDALESLVDRLLASPHFGERWGRHWLDAAGYVDVIGSDNDAEIIKVGEQKWLYRDYVVDALNTDLPYDRFLHEQIAGDELVDWRGADRFTPEIRRLLVATGYLRAAIDDTDQDELNTADIRFRVIHKTLDVVGTGLLGLTVGCCRCHSHKYDPLPQRDYYRLMAIFAPAYNVQSWLTLAERFLPDVSPAQKARIEKLNADLDSRITPLKKRITAVEGAVGARLVTARLATVPEPIRADTRKALETPKEKRTRVQEYLAGKFPGLLTAKPGDVEKGLRDGEREEVGRLRRQVSEIDAGRRSWGKIHALWDVTAPPRTFLLRRGDHHTPGAEVQPGFIAVISDDTDPLPGSAVPAGSSGRRLALARWLTAPDTPAGGLVARVRVNRIWQHLLGVGPVATPENFGHSGARPTHPELLDWLARSLVRQGWHVKPLIRTIVTSSVYRQASARGSGAGNAGDPTVVDPHSVDPANHLLWRARLRQIESEVLRDSILAVSGRLERTLGGPPILLRNRPDGTVVVADGVRAPRRRRSLYVLARRNYHLSFLGVFNQPVVNTNCTRRAPSADVIQSLTLMNDAFVLEHAGYMATRVGRAGGERERQIERAFTIALCRPPRPREIEWSTDLLERQTARFAAAGETPATAAQKALATLCHALFNTSEFLHAQ